MGEDNVIEACILGRNKRDAKGRKQIESGEGATYPVRLTELRLARVSERYEVWTIGCATINDSNGPQVRFTLVVRSTRRQ